MDKKFKLSPFTIKRYEPTLGLYVFFNVKNRTFWETDFKTGSIVAALDGTLSLNEVVDILISNNKEISQDKLRNFLENKLDYLLKEEFICCEN